MKSGDDKEYSTKKLRGKIIVLIMGNRKIRKEDNKWGKIIQKDFERNNHVATFIVGDMRSIPSFVPKNFIKKYMQKKPDLSHLYLTGQGRFINNTKPSRTGRIIFRKSWKLSQHRYL